MNQSSEGQFLQCQSKQIIQCSQQNQNQNSDCIALLQNPQKFLKIFQEIYARGNLLAKVQKFAEASQCFLKCNEMIQIESNIIKKDSKYWPIVIYINLAFTYQNDWKIQKTNKYLQKAQELLLQLINEISKQQKEEYLNLSLRYNKLKYQQCAVLSQLNQHQKALKICESALPILRQNIEFILDHAKKQYTLSHQQQNQYGVRFGVKVYSFAEEIFNNLIAKMKLSSVASQFSTLKKNSSMEFYYWEKNPQINQKQLRNSFIPKYQKQITAKRSILGVTKQKTWIDDFNIGFLMKLSLTNVQDWQKLTPFEEYFFKQKIYEYVIYTSVGYFTMATQMRLIDSGKKINHQESNLKSKHEEIKKKYGYEEKTQQFALSESHHLTAISIITQNIQTLIPYLSHIIKSFDKHYIFKKKLDEILAIPEQSILDASKLSGIKIPSRTVSKTSNLARSVEKESQIPFTRGTDVYIEDQEYGCSYVQNLDKKSDLSSSSQKSQKQRLDPKTERKSLNNIKKLSHQLNKSIKNKTSMKSFTAQKLSQTLKPSSKAKIISHQSFQQLRNSIGCIQKKSTQKLTKNKQVSKKKIQLKNKQKVKEKFKEKQKKFEKNYQKQTCSTSKELHKSKFLKNSIKQKSNQSTEQGEKQIPIKHKSLTNLKLVFKKKKA